LATLNLTITVPDAHAARIKNSFCAYHGWTATIQDPAFPGDITKRIPNPVTQVAFIKSKVAQFLKDSVKAYEVNVDSDAARIARITEVEGLVIL
jgi:hypothetical protein